MEVWVINSAQWPLEEKCETHELRKCYFMFLLFAISHLYILIQITVAAHDLFLFLFVISGCNLHPQYLSFKHRNTTQGFCPHLVDATSLTTIRIYYSNTIKWNINFFPLEWTLENKEKKFYSFILRIWRIVACSNYLIFIEWKVVQEGINYDILNSTIKKPENKNL